MNRSTPERGSAALYAALAAALCLVIGAGASLAATKIPPGIAGVPSQGTDHLSGPADLGDGQSVESENRVYRPTVLQCYTWPDGTITQTKDPRSPACVAGWDDTRGNGGSTAPGVEGNVIRVGVPAVTPDLQIVAEYFNSHYEFYGRSLQLVPIGAVNSRAAQQASVAEAKAQRVFAAIDVDAKNSVTSVDPDLFLSDLAANHIVGITGGRVIYGRTLTDNGPYAWSLSIPADQLDVYLTKFVCTTLAGKPARLSPQFTTTTRKFALLAIPPEGDAAPPDVDPVVKRLSDCGVSVKTYQLRKTRSDTNPAISDKLLYQQLKESGVTSLVLVGEPNIFTFSGPYDLSALDYHPEFITSRSDESTWPLTPRDQWGQVVALADGPPPAYFMLDPVIAVLLESGYTMRQAGNALSQLVNQAYSRLSVIAAGIQGAGPDLTPETFAAGLESTKFPNPANTAAWGFGGLGFQLGDHVMERDVTLQWYDGVRFASNVPVNLRASPGRMCLLLDGKRFSLDDEFPSSDAGYYDLTKDCDGPGTRPDSVPEAEPPPPLPQ